MSFDELISGDFDEFKAFLAKLDQAVAVGSCALYYDSTYQLNNLQLFDRDGTEFTSEEWEEARERADALDQLMVFAFGHAPDEAVRSWAATFLDQEKVDHVAMIVDHMRENMPALENAWDARSSRLGPAIGDITTHVVVDGSQGEFSAIVRADSFYAAGARSTPLAGSRTFFEARMTRSDLRRAIAVLAHAVAEMDHYMEGARNAND